MKKRFFSIIMCAGLLLSCAACGCSKSSADYEYDVNDYVTLCDYKGMDINLSSSYKESDQGYDSYVGQVLANYLGYKTSSETTVAEDSIINVDYVGYHDGKAFDGGAASDQWIDVKNCSSATSGSSYITGFTDGLAGSKVGQEVRVDVTFPENYQDSTLAGEDAYFMFTINSIGQPYTIDDLTDQIVASTFSSYTSVASLDKRLNSDYQEYVDTQISKAVRSEIITQLKSSCKVEVPAELLNLRVEEYIDTYEKDYCADGQELDDYLQENLNMSLVEFRKEVIQEVKKDLITELILEAIAKKEGLKVDKEGFEEYCSELMTNNSYSDEKTLYEAYGTNANSGKKYLKKVYLATKACDFVEENANISYE